VRAARVWLRSRVPTVLGTAAPMPGVSEFVLGNEAPVAELTAAMARGAGQAAIGLAAFTLYHAFPAWVYLAALTYCPARGLAGLVLAATLGGWAIAASLAGQVYEDVSFSVIWPSLGWHLPMTIALAIFAVRHALRHSDLAAVALCAGIGLAWGGLATWPWGDLPPEARLAPADFAALAVWTTGLWAAGHLCLDRLGDPEFRTGPVEAGLRGAFTLLLAGLDGWGHATGLALSGLGVLASLGALGRGRHSPVDPVVPVLTTRPLPWRYAWMALAPVRAVAVYAGLFHSGADPSGSVLALFLYGSIATLALWLWAVWHGLTARPFTAP
jgi:hypothetical protein